MCISKSSDSAWDCRFLRSEISKKPCVLDNFKTARVFDDRDVEFARYNTNATLLQKASLQTDIGSATRLLNKKIVTLFYTLSLVDVEHSNIKMSEIYVK